MNYMNTKSIRQRFKFTQSYQIFNVNRLFKVLVMNVIEIMHPVNKSQSLNSNRTWYKAVGITCITRNAIKNC